MWIDHSYRLKQTSRPWSDQVDQVDAETGQIKMGFRTN